MADLKLFLFGTPRLERGGEAIDVETRKATALLAYLAVSGLGHTREALAGMLWPDFDQSRALANLRRTLWALNKSKVGDLIEADGETVRLNPSAGVWVDAREFEERLAESRTHGHAEAETCPACLPLLVQAAELYRADFLSGFALRDSAAFEEWQFFQAERLRRDMAEALERLALLSNERGQAGDAIGYARRWLALDALQEAAQRCLMRLYAQTGQRSAALRQYQECERLLREELGAAPQPETTVLYEQIQAGGLAGSPAAATQAAAPDSPPRHNLPAQLSSFVGREREQADIAQRLQSNRLVTLTGPGGSGKTRLALRAAEALVEAYPDGVWLAELTPLSDPALILPTIAAVFGVREAAGRPLLDGLIRHLRDRQTLLMLDNCEHLIEASARLIEALLRGAPRLHVLATSREPLGLSGESVCRVPSLSLPEAGALALEQLARSEAGRLFEARAADVKSGFTLSEANAAAVAQICQRLDGIPLALELAAARVRVMPPEQIAVRLDDRFRLLTGGSRTALPRQQTLRALIDWSWDLLLEPERSALRRLSVFVGGWTLEAAERVCASGDLEGATILDTLTRLVDKSLVLAEEQDGRERYRMLETMRQYAREKLLESGESGQVRDRHLEFFVVLGENGDAGLHGPEETAWLSQLETEHANLRAALEWSLDGGQAGAETGLRLCGALGQFWNVRGHWTEGLAWLTRVLARPETAGPTLTRAKALNASGFLAYCLSDYAAAQRRYEEALSIWRAHAPCADHATALRILGAVLSNGGRSAAGRAPLEESLAMSRALGDDEGVAWTLLDISEQSLNRATTEAGRVQAIATLEESLGLHRRLGNLNGVSVVLTTLASTDLHFGDLEEAGARYGESLAIGRRIGNRRTMSLALIGLGNVAAVRGEHASAERLLSESLPMIDGLGQRALVADTLLSLGWIHTARGELETAAERIAAGHALINEIGDGRGLSYANHCQGQLLYYQGQFQAARGLLQESLAQARETGAWWLPPLSLSLLGWMAHRAGDSAAALAMLRESLVLLRERHRKTEYSLALERWAGASAGAGMCVRAATVLGAADALREAMRSPVAPVEQKDRERTLADVRDHLDPSDFARAWAEGRAMALEDWTKVIDFALGG